MIFAINTSTRLFSIALIKEQGTIFCEYLISPGSKNFKNLMPTINYMLESTGSGLRDLKAVIVAMGPGSFTGLRVGLSAAKGIAYGLNIPIIGVSSLEAMAGQLPYYKLYKICTMISSRKGEIFAALFSYDDEGRMKRVMEDISLKLKDLASIIDGPTLFIGNNFDDQGYPVKELIGKNAFLAPPFLWNLRASSVATLGRKRFLNKDFDDIRDLVPIYRRSPDIRSSPFPVITEKVNSFRSGSGG